MTTIDNRVDLSITDNIASVVLNRPDKGNALDQRLWNELREAFTTVDRTPEARVAVLSARGPHFCVGADVALLADIPTAAGADPSCQGRTGEAVYYFVLGMQEVMSSIERCRKPVVAAIHGACVGGGLDMVTACDLRYATDDTRFAIKEIDMGLAADVGVLQRLAKLVGEGLTRELAYTAREMRGREAKEIKLVNGCHDSYDDMLAHAHDVARTIASKSPLAVRGSKRTITYARDHSTADALEQIASWNATTLLSADLTEAIDAYQNKRSPTFRD